MKNHWTVRWLALSSFLGMPTLATTLVLAMMHTPGFDRTSTALSLLAVGDTPHAGLVKMGLVVFGALLVPTGFASYQLQGRTKMSLIVGALFAATGLATAMAGSVSAGSQEVLLGVSAGTWHMVAAAIAGGAGLGVVVLQTYMVRRRPRWQGFYRFSLALIATAAVAGGISALDLWPAMIGIYERYFLIAGVVWLATLAIKLFRHQPEGAAMPTA